MTGLNPRHAAFRIGWFMTAAALLISLSASLSCRRKEAAPTGTSGAVYYEGPMKPKGGGAAAPASPR
jgi:hypothetical protein